MTQQDFSEELPPVNGTVPTPKETAPVPETPEIDANQFDVSTVWPDNQESEHRPG
jgi:hypothetical protein